MHKIIFSIFGLFILTTSLWIWYQKPAAETPIEMKPQIEKITYADKFKGQVKQIKILYTSANKNFTQKEFIIVPQNNILPRSSRDKLFNVKDYLVSYVIENTQDNFIELDIEPAKNRFSISGVTAKSNISVWSNQKSILGNTPVDWSGKLEFNSLDKKGISLAHTQNICFYLLNEDLEICHSPIQDQGGII